MRFFLYFLMLNIAIMASPSFGFSFSKAMTPSKAYWLWAGITEDLAPKNSDLYIYQGIIEKNQKQSSSQHRGLYAYPISCKKCYLVYRLSSSLPKAKQVVAVFLNDAKKWERHQITIRGLQIDYDSPTSKLALYSQFLAEIRKYLPSQYELDITGLGEWITAGNIQVLKVIADSTENIVFQLYDDRHPLPHSLYYIQALKHYPYPFRLGVLQAFPLTHEVSQLRKNPHFLGVIYFIQKS